ncbi:MAG: ABC transporter permease [Alphaproteobacteria bacterium]|jgi:galactofuranose transport system permease protein|nr:ABC transporter permease [Alphaproteobacteria bacterium]MBU0802849.1 ABC transporter permease [Alphaproteobacteria bacterium]MBU0871646.1 ABC transporter permease [Alphaproteobacteria bacterium]MBU1400313.1 ABC transporter permease [Alphaproteobacteria bacterium]MBU1591433.1 ABC transporter permease [Alphaproteobacteria bacterium]
MKGWHISPSMAVVAVLIVLTLLGAWRYDGFVSAYNVQSVLRYNSMFALVALGMCFVIMTGGIDLSVGSVAAFSSVVAAHLSGYGLLPGLLGGLGAGVLAGTLNAIIITRLKILPFIATLATMLAASGTALLLANNQSVSVSYETGFVDLGQGDLLSFMRPEWVDGDNAGVFGGILGFILSFPTPAFIALAAYIVAAIVIGHTAFGRHILASGGGTEASRLMGLPVDRTIFFAYVISGATAGMAGVILAAQFGAGQPIEGIGWELFAIASVVVGGTLLTGGKGSIGGTLAGALLLGIIFTILNFENGMGWISLSAYWQSVVRGAFLFVVVVLQAKLSLRAQE